jgi:acetyl esterase
MPSSVKLTPRERAEYRAARALSYLPPRVKVGLSGRRRIRLDGQELDPEMQLTLSLLEKRGDPELETLPPELGRAQTRRQAQVFAGIEIRVGAVRDLEVPGGAGPLPARHYAPAEVTPGPHPLLVFLHGGGFVIGDLETHDVCCRLLCKHGGVHVLAVDYRLAPEHPFPAPVEDAVAATRWALERGAAELGADPGRVAVGGDSAGGNLAAVACQVLAGEGGPTPFAQLLIYPTTDAHHTGGSADLFAEGFFLTRPQMDWFGEQYLGRTRTSTTRGSPRARGGSRGCRPRWSSPRASTRSGTRARRTRTSSARRASRCSCAASPASSTASST